MHDVSTLSHKKVQEASHNKITFYIVYGSNNFKISK